MDNASVILTTFDRHLDHAASLIVYGRAAIQLGFNEPPAEVADVAFLIRHAGVTRAHLEETMRRARLPDIPELHDAFAKARPRVLALAVA
jgi:hypothetical protein